MPDVLFYYAFGLFKIAVIVQQIYARYVRGHTRDPRFARLNDLVAALSEQADQAHQLGVESSQALDSAQRALAALGR